MGCELANKWSGFIASVGHDNARRYFVVTVFVWLCLIVLTSAQVLVNSNETEIANTVSHIDQSACNQSITEKVDALLRRDGQVPMKMPYGRAFVAIHFGQALFYDSPRANNTFKVRSCYLDSINWTSIVGLEESRYGPHHRHHHHTRHLCHNVSLAGMIVGPDLTAPLSIVPELLQGGDHDRPICEWTVAFSQRLKGGSYTLRIWTYRINEGTDMTNSMMNLDHIVRHNYGEIVSLSGLGKMFGPDLIGYETLDLTGHIVQKGRGQPLYLVQNRSLLRGFDTWNAYVAGRNNFDAAIYTMPEAYFSNKVFVKPDLTNVTVLNVSLKVAGMGNFKYLSRISEVQNCFDEDAHKESHAYGLPAQVELPNSTVEEYQGPIRLCNPRSVSISQGRWVRTPQCEEWTKANSRAQRAIYGSIAPGELCRQTEPVVQAGGVNNRYRGYVFKPWDCDLVQFDTHELSVSTAVAKKLNTSVFCNIIDRIRGATDRDQLTFTKTAKQYFEAVRESHSIPVQAADATSSLHTPASLCFRSAGIGLLAGMGDSLGVEQLDDLKNMFGNHEYWDDERHVIACTGEDGGEGNYMQFVREGPRLVKCVEDAVDLMMNASNSHMSLFPYNTTFGNQPLRAIKAEDRNTAAVPVSTILLVTNFMAQHNTGKIPKVMIEEGLHEQVKLQSALAERLKSKYNLNYRRIYMTGTASHGFQYPYLNNGRQRWLAQRAEEILGGVGGFEIFDAYNITVSRPDGSKDSTHYEGGVARAITDVLLQKLCLNQCQLPIR
jgi:hypothetical protein